MAVATMDIFRLVGTLVDEVLDIPDIVARMITCRDAYKDKSEAAEALTIFSSLQMGWDLYIRRMLATSRPLNMQRAEEILCVHLAFQRNLCGESPIDAIARSRNWNYPPGAKVPSLMDMMRWWLWDNSADCTLQSMERHLKCLLRE
jgi:hypothetical protein